ncbi:MAG: hypothetical protein KJ852_12845 [Gammaproteobacteria bacterium]|nr:hypothetical protein [Gammaproteobacteria bacterium]MBU0786433.1 hypothetical protein [Gammaproteobacteria bacterium]MBU0816136.1 hypothetical protein [Gammaproteobacteria bacterium]MBU1787838.1 hypothetical protein [Gammaproteobacteria bacterium]
MMNQISPLNPAISLFQRLQSRKSPVSMLMPPSMTEETLPFTVRVVSSTEDLNKAVAIRHAAYARHLPEFAETLKNPEPYDFDDGVAILLAESKLDGSALGSMRIQTNLYAPLDLEDTVSLPNWLQGRSLAEASRLGVTQDRVGRMVKTVLFKAFFDYCEQQRVDYMVITARSPVDRQYERLMFDDVYPDLGYVPLKHVANLPHRIMSFEVATAETRWAAAQHPLFNFIFRTHHPDIDVTKSALRVERRNVLGTSLPQATAAVC